VIKATTVDKSDQIKDIEPQWFFFPATTYICSSEFALFIKDFHSCVEYFSYMGQLAHSADKVKKIARDALSYPAVLEDAESNLFSAIKKYERFGGLSVRHITNVVVDAFLWYVSSMAQRVLVRRPEMLKTKEQVRIEEIVEFSSKRELVKFLVDRKVSRLAYSGLQEIETYLSDSFGIELFVDPDERTKVRFLVEVRNINAHNRGHANSIFLGRTTGFKEILCTEGKPVMLKLKIFELCEALVMAAMRFDKACCSKFKIRQRSISTQIDNKETVRELDLHHKMYLHAVSVGWAKPSL
jgi:hypothetical protein